MLWACAIAVAGVLIGATGVGGVFVVPVLHELRGVDFRAAIAAASLAFGLPGVLALLRLRRARGALSGHEPLLIMATVPGALLGSLFVQGADTRVLLGSLGVATLASGAWGLWELWRPRRRGAALAGPANGAVRTSAVATAAPLSRWPACAAGCAVGFGSAVTGTGGPVMLWPVMMVARQELRGSLVVAQAIQLPIALCASAAHFAAGGIDLRLSALVGAILTVGALFGQAVGTWLSAARLRTAVCVLLVATGSFYLQRVLA